MRGAKKEGIECNKFTVIISFSCSQESQESQEKR